jgi:hypothetical protein
MKFVLTGSHTKRLTKVRDTPTGRKSRSIQSHLAGSYCSVIILETVDRKEAVSIFGQLENGRGARFMKKLIKFPAGNSNKLKILASSRCLITSEGKWPHWHVGFKERERNGNLRGLSD